MSPTQNKGASVGDSSDQSLQTASEWIIGLIRRCQDPMSFSHFSQKSAQLVLLGSQQVFVCLFCFVVVLGLSNDTPLASNYSK